MIRRPKFAELSSLADIMGAAHARSKWAAAGAMDRKEAIRLLTGGNQRHGLKAPGGTFLMMADHDGAARGFLLGSIDRVYHVGTKLQTSDDFFICEPGGDPMDPLRLITAYIDWAEHVPDVVQIQLSHTDFIAGEHIKGLDRVYRHLGFRECGTLYEKVLQ
jgi:hypothetical protein